MKQFDITAFDVIDIQRRGESELQLNKRYMTFTKSLIEEMNWPPYVRMLVSVKEGIFAVQACRGNDENAYRFSMPRGEQQHAKYCSTNSILKAVIAAMGDKWDDKKFFGFRGTYYPDAKAMVFDLKDGYKRNVKSVRRNRL